MKTLILITALIIGCNSMLFSHPKPSAELQEELNQVPLTVTGEIPQFLSGTLVRNGPVTVSIDGQTNAHWFDGLAMLHAFSFDAGEVSYTNRFLRTDAYASVFEKGSLRYDGFAEDPCRSLFKQFFTWLFPPSTPALHNANVNVAKIAGECVALTETPLPVRFDLETLDTLGVLDYQDDLPHKSCWESAHPHYDVQTEETINYLIEYGRTSYYIFYTLSKDSSERKVFARIPVQDPAYMHSFAVTENYIILTEFPFVVKPLDLLIKNVAFIKNFSWQPERGTLFTVIDRRTGKCIEKYRSDPFFAFHHVNAFESQGNIYLDIVCYDDAEVIMGIAKTSGFEPSFPTRFERFILSLETGKISSETLLEESIEFPRIHEAFDAKPYAYAYLADVRSPTFPRDLRPLYKIDTHTKAVLKWEEAGCYPGEPVFVADPSGKEEDAGVILSVVSNPSQNSSFLLILEAKTFREIARAQVTHPIPKGLHGHYFLQEKS